MVNARIIVSDEKQLFREGLCRMLYQLAWVSYVAGFSATEEAVNAISKQEVNLFILNPYAASGPQYFYIEEIRAVKSDIKIALLTDYDDAVSILEATKYPINGYFSKSTAFEKFESYLLDVMEGKYRLSESFGFLLFERLVKKNGIGELTEREWGVYQMMKKGYTNKEIANRLSISTNTVRNHVSSIMCKLNLSSRYRTPSDYEK